MVSKWTFLFQGLIFRFHVKFWGCIYLDLLGFFYGTFIGNISSIYHTWIRHGQEHVCLKLIGFVELKMNKLGMATHIDEYIFRK